MQQTNVVLDRYDQVILLGHLVSMIRRKAHGKIVFCISFIATLLGGLCVVFALVAFRLEPDSIRVTEYRISLDGPEDHKLGGLRIAIIADLHAGAPFIDDTKVKRVVTMTNATKPDLILLLGDYVITGVLGGRHMQMSHIAGLLQPLTANMGVYAVLGNHDHCESGVAITDALRRAKIIPLSNESVGFSFGAGKFYLLGIDDYVTHKSDPVRALSAVPDGASAICFTHSPDVFPLLPKKCRLTIAGHTHGGQVNFPLLGRLVVPSKYRFRYAAGFHREGDKSIFVGTGIGTSVIPVRFGVPPEISLLTLN